MKKDSKKGSTLLSRPNSGVLPYIKSLTTEVVTLLSLVTYPMSEISPKECGYHD